MKVLKHEWKYKGYHIFRVSAVPPTSHLFKDRGMFKVVSYANDFKPQFFPTLKTAKKWIDQYLSGGTDRTNFGGVF